MKKIVIVEDESAMARGITDALKHNGYETFVANNGESGIEIIEEKSPDLILLDVMLPGMDGFDVCKTLRDSGLTTPIIMLTARSEEVDKVLGLEFGADDYVTKPFSNRELIARIKAQLRRQSIYLKENLSEYTFGDIYVNFAAYVLKRNNIPVDLTSTEFSILQLLIKKRGQIVSRDQILNEVWGYEIIPDSRIVDTHILNLRKKIEKNAQKPDYIKTHHGIGYKFAG